MIIEKICFMYDKGLTIKSLLQYKIFCTNEIFIYGLLLLALIGVWKLASYFMIFYYED
jgi:hypothetical protein